MKDDRSASSNQGQQTYKNLASSRSLFGKGKLKPTFGMTITNVKTVRNYNQTEKVDKYSTKLNQF